ncbi:hypothetical protein ACFYUV_51175 [Nonomuraea sp. NPDC003560]|uniref:hypothetical protein n=1 Tax=Nonomuraea sp. NPDC003560 TaxID=3364341 RepID=UPI003686D45F
MVRLSAAACGFGYRTSVFKTQPGRWTILAVILRLTVAAAPRPSPTGTLDVLLGSWPPLAEAVTAVLADRRARPPCRPTAASAARPPRRA